MPVHQRKKNAIKFIILCLVASLTFGCANMGGYTTERDKTAKGAGIGAAAGAAIALLRGKRQADDILAGAAIGAVIGGGVGAYMDHQEEKLTRIPGTSVEKIGDNTLLVRFNSDVLFATDSSQVDPTGQATLDSVARVFVEYDKTAVIVQGHTDSTGTEAYNQSLSERRADAVRNHLIARGVAAARIAAIGYGESYPVARNDTAAGRQMNRRVDILLKANAR